MVRAFAGIRAWCCPKISELSPGQIVWLTYSTKKSRRIDPRLFVPVVLTLLDSAEQTLTLSHHGEFKALKVRQIERMTTEAWRQEGVLTSSDLEWLTFASSTTIRICLEAYQERYGVILPTAGTVLDMGRTLTHKKIVVEMALDGMTTKEIAERIYHTPVAVDAYLKTFDRLLILPTTGCRCRLLPESWATAADLSRNICPWQRNISQQKTRLRVILKDVGLHWKGYVRRISGYLRAT